MFGVFYSLLSGEPSTAVGGRRNRTPMTNFARAEDGGVLIPFSLLFMMMMVFVGSAIDLSRWMSARTQTLNAVDAAVLAGARSLQVNPGDMEAAEAAAESFYEQNTQSRPSVVNDSIKFTVSQNLTTIQASGNAWVETPFLKFAHVDKLPLVKMSNAEFAEAKVAVGGNSETNVEVSMMLDITGSMAGSKIEDLKLAAKDLIDIVVWDDQSKFTSRVALVPFSEAIRIDNTLKSSLNISGPSSYTFKHKSTKKNTTYKRDANCVTERLGIYAMLDNTPTPVSGPGLFYDSNGSCLPTSGTIMPLTSDKNALKEAIDAYQASGNTAGHLGTAWAWYMLSPDWKNVLPSANHPEPYSKLAEQNSKGTPKLRKIAVLMTDGEYNTEYCPTGVVTSALSCSLLNGDSAAQAATLCTNMKAKGIDVYTVGFELGNNNAVLDLLRNCASSTEQFFQAEDGEQLKQAFRNIALRISDLYLSK